MSKYKQRIEYLAHAYIGIAKREFNWDRVKDLIEKDKTTELDVKNRIKEILRR